jgi:hypothetical protein
MSDITDYIVHLLSKEHGILEEVHNKYDYICDVLLKMCRTVYPHIKFTLEPQNNEEVLPIITGKIEFDMTEKLL